METIKSYTDINQSKKLAEFLPIESADMYYMKTSCNNYTIGVLQRMERDMLLNQAEYYKMFPCWSLAALFNILPKNLNICRPSLDSNYKGYYWIQYYDEFMQPNDYKTECFNNPIDACVNMIIKLKELNLLLLCTKKN